MEAVDQVVEAPVVAGGGMVEEAALEVVVRKGHMEAVDRVAEDQVAEDPAEGDGGGGDEALFVLNCDDREGTECGEGRDPLVI
ncbi:hypothetical protein CRG98_009825 [Punica granatum]|uniref:Uncharacterized protein n=1 Tax=Punica granatum TaxID=22663 RepID=A0A2I0KNP0_PUNGR|nr:hypothetical protein CRG98_009825 [Punica granatum]